MSQYVCAFRGRRDAYQVPLALAESGQLDQLITDVYALNWVRAVSTVASASVRTKMAFRFQAGIPTDRVHCLWRTTAFEQIRHQIGFSPLTTHRMLDGQFSNAAAQRASKYRSDLFLYNSYAWEAFTAHYQHEPRKILFQYHPHPELENSILAADSALHPSVNTSWDARSRPQLPESIMRRERDCWKYADLIFCASTFTKYSIIKAGADERKCRVVPYGIDVSPTLNPQMPSQDFHVSFVGSGSQRKGLHHLLLAWGRSSLPKSSKLTLVCRVIDRGIDKLASTIPGVELKRGVNKEELARVFANTTLFVMPSLVEGFGQVYLEALAHGCPILGTRNTCLPDLGGEKDGVFLVSPGNIDELVSEIELLSRVLPGNQPLREACRACARRFPWCRFRTTLRDKLTS